MTLITCPDCQREVSSRATACPHCGGPIAPGHDPASEPVKRGVQRAGARHDVGHAIGGIAFAIGLVVALFGQPIAGFVIAVAGLGFGIFVQYGR